MCSYTLSKSRLEGKKRERAISERHRADSSRGYEAFSLARSLRRAWTYWIIKAARHVWSSFARFVRPRWLFPRFNIRNIGKRIPGWCPRHGKWTLKLIFLSLPLLLHQSFSPLSFVYLYFIYIFSLFGSVWRVVRSSNNLLSFCIFKSAVSNAWFMVHDTFFSSSMRSISNFFFFFFLWPRVWKKFVQILPEFNILSATVSRNRARWPPEIFENNPSTCTRYSRRNSLETTFKFLAQLLRESREGGNSRLGKIPRTDKEVGCWREERGRRWPFCRGTRKRGVARIFFMPAVGRSRLKGRRKAPARGAD